MKHWLVLPALALVCGCGAASTEADAPDTDNGAPEVSPPATHQAPIEDESFRPIAVEEPEIGECPEGDDGYCRAAQAQLRHEWPQALKGDYQAQRNVAFSFGRGQSAAVKLRPSQACAWRIAIMASGSPKVDETDGRNYQMDCGKLDEAGLDRANKVAGLIFEKIYSRPIGPVPMLAPSK
jgi:hypothetical protein